MTATVLIADDDPDILELMTALLTEEGFHIVAFSDGLTALHHIRVQRPAMAIIDLSMPVMDGRELIGRLRQEPGPPLPIIAMSAGLTTASLESLEVDACLTKPFDLEELLEHVHYFTSQRAEQSSLRPTDQGPLIPARPGRLKSRLMEEAGG